MKEYSDTEILNFLEDHQASMGFHNEDVSIYTDYFTCLGYTVRDAATKCMDALEAIESRDIYNTQPTSSRQALSALVEQAQELEMGYESTEIHGQVSVE